MADISLQQEQQLREAFANFDENAVSSADLVAAEGPIDLFCDNWPRVKQVLRFIAGLPAIPQSIKNAIAKVIAAGDLAASVICPR